MNFEPSAKVKELQKRLQQFMDEHIYPDERTYLEQVARRRSPGGRRRSWRSGRPRRAPRDLWNLFLPESEHGAGLTNLEYAPLVRDHGPLAGWLRRPSTARRPIPATWRCWRATVRPSRRSNGWSRCWQAKIRSVFCMTEPAVASSDATNIQSSIVRDGDSYVINGAKWWSTRRGPSAVQDLHLHGQDRSHGGAAQAAVDDPGAARHAGREDQAAAFRSSATTKRRTATREIAFENVRVPASNILLGEGPRLRDRAGPAGAGTHPSLHAADRTGRARAGS